LTGKGSQSFNTVAYKTLAQSLLDECLIEESKYEEDDWYEDNLLVTEKPEELIILEEDKHEW